MEFRLTDEQLMIREMARRFAEEEIRPIADRNDKMGEYPRETIRRLAELQFMGISVPTEWGGAGLDMLSYVLALEEISKACAATGVIMSVNNSLVCHLINAHGTTDQKERYLKKLASGEWLGCYALTEPEAGSDAANQRTTAIPEGDHYVVNGRKAFITNGAEARVAIVYANADPSKGKKGISAFIVDTESPGFIVEKKERKLGIRGSSCVSLVFDGLRVPKENLLGELGGGLKLALGTLEVGRIGIAAQALGIHAAALEESIKYSLAREQFGRPIAQFQATQWRVADMAVALEAARLLTYRAATLKGEGRRTGTESSMAKLFASESCMHAAWAAVQLHGGYGYIEDYIVERLFRDAKVTEIYEGTSEVQKMLIARNVIGAVPA